MYVAASKILFERAWMLDTVFKRKPSTWDDVFYLRSLLSHFSQVCITDFFFGGGGREDIYAFLFKGYPQERWLHR